ncbi:MAG: hypothetical protein DRI44_06620 [Chlamydiae bacterium]|nr:MAG: hypothetical protein DRI44_06620 [Chlamydiota bacterium]
MKFKTTLLLLIIVIAAAFYLKFVDSKKLSTEELQRIEKRVFRKFKPERITGMKLKITDRQDETGKVVNVREFEIERTPTGWNIKKPVSFPADSAKTRRILDLVKKIDQSRILVGDDYKNLDRKGAGLESPNVIATFETPATSMVFKIGYADPIGWNNYVEIEGRKAVFLVPAHFKDSLLLKTDNSQDDVRRDNIFDARKYLINSIIMEHKDFTVELRRQDDLAWRIIRPINDAANSDEVNKLLGLIEKMRVDSFVDSSDIFGKRKLRLTVIQGAVSQSLLVGNDCVENPKTSYARRSAYQQYFTVKNDELDPFMQGADSYRSRLFIVKNMFQDTVHLTVKSDGNTFEYDKNQNKKWTMPGVTTPLLDETKLDDYIYDWEGLNITNFAISTVAKKALANIGIQLILKFEGLDEPMELSLSKPVNGLVYAERSPGIYISFDENTIKRLNVKNELGFLIDSLVDVPAKRVREVSVVDGGKEFKLVLSSNKWTAITPNSVREIKTDVLADIDKALPISVKKYVANTLKDKSIDPASYGLNPPYQKFTFTNGKPWIILIGKKDAYGNRYAMLSGEPYIFIIEKDSYDKLNKLLDDACNAVISNKK